MECKEIKQLLYEYENNRLDEITSNQVNTHLKECTRCQLERKELRKTLKMLDHAKPPKISAGFQERVMEQINREERKKGYWKWVLQGTVAATIILAAVTISRVVFPPQVEKIPRQFGMMIKPIEVENPIIIMTDNLDISLEKLIDLINQYDGQIVRRKILDSKKEITFRIAERNEKVFFQSLNRIGAVQIKKEGYKDDLGNIMIILNLKGKEH